MAREESRLPKLAAGKYGKDKRINRKAMDERTVYHDIGRAQKSETEEVDPFYMDELENLR